MALLNIDNLYIKVSPAELNEKENRKDLFKVELYKSLRSRELAKKVKTQSEIVKEVQQFINKQYAIFYNELFTVRGYLSAEIREIKKDYINFKYKNPEDKKWCIKTLNELSALKDELYIYQNIDYTTELVDIKFKKLSKLYPGILKSVGNIITVFNIHIPGGDNMTLEEIYNYLKENEMFGSTLDC